MNTKPDTAWPFHPWLLLGVFPVLALGYAAFDSSLFLAGEMSRGQVIGRDFVIFWGASVMLWRGDVWAVFDPTQFQPALERLIGQNLAFMPYPYPPHSLFIIAPLAALPQALAFPAWIGGTFCGVVALLRRWGVGWVTILAVLLSPASIVNICSGQNGFLTAALLGGGLMLLPTRPVLAGILIGCLSYKPQLGLLLPLILIAGGYWRSFLVAAITVVLLVVGSLAVTGPDIWRLYFDATTPQQLALMQYGSGFFQQMSPSYFMTVRLLGGGLAAAWIAQALVAIVVAIASVWIFRSSAPHELKVALILTATALLSPYILTYDLVIVVLAVILAARCDIWHWAEKGVFFLAWSVPLLAVLPLPPLGAAFLSLLFLVIGRRAWRAAD